MDGGRKKEIKDHVKELTILESELKSLKPGASVYKKQPNSHILFKDDKYNLFSAAKKDMDDLIQEYKDAGGSAEDLKSPSYASS